MHGAHTEPIKLAAPGIGAPLTRVIPSEYFETLLSVSLLLATSATVANRLPQIAFADGDGNVFGEYASTAAIPATTTSRITGAVDVDDVTAGTNTLVTIGLPRLLLPPGFRWTISAAGIDPGDQFSVAYALLWRVPTGPLEQAPGATPYTAEFTVEYP